MRPRGGGRPYCRGPLKRGFDVVVSFLSLLALSPVLLVVALAVLVSSGPPVLFRQDRIGRDGRPFRIVKFRTMGPGADRGLPITGRGDPRVTPVGRLLRAAKLDELPQLFNVLRGEMSLVGPRPEVPRYVLTYGAQQKRVLEVRPGLTDPATVLFSDEESLLGAVGQEGRERFYLDEVLPKKIGLNLRYIDEAGFWYDIRLILKTLKVLVLPTKA